MTRIYFSDTFQGSHLNSGNQTEYVSGLVGVVWTASVSGSCGGSDYNSSGTTKLGSNGLVDPNSEPWAEVYDFNDCVVGDTITVSFHGAEGPLASGTGLTVNEQIIIDFTAPPPTQKQVFLAWAGQRIILEHDWRIAPGDYWRRRRLRLAGRW